MGEIIFNDIITAFWNYVPFAIITGVLVMALIFIILCAVQKTKISTIVELYLPKLFLGYIFFIYCFAVAAITLFSREPGSRDRMDLMLFSTFSPDFNSNVFPVENIILFIPFGILLPILVRRFRNAVRCFTAGFAFSLMIEVIQYLTKRGYFQTDDIITNVFGTFIGYLIMTGFVRIVILYKK